MAEVRRPRTRASISYLLLWLVTGIKKYGPAFLLECIIFYLALLAYQAIGYFGRFGPVEAISLGLLLVPICMAAGEATFRLYRRVWVVAGLQDAIAIALAVAEAALILTLLNRLIPSDIRPYRFPVPLLAAPTAAAAIALFRLLPRLLELELRGLVRRAGGGRFVRV